MDNSESASSKVYFTNFRTTFQEGLLPKMRRLMIAAGIKDIDFAGKYVAIKMHFGEVGNLAFLRPNYAKVVVDLVRELGGKPFLVDCNTLYVGSRKNALDHLDAAYLNGFSPLSTGCHVLIGDGLKGTDEVYVPVPRGEYVKEAKIGRVVMDADIVISLNHFKAHEATGFGGAIKNIGMGCGSRAGKMEMHSAGKPYVYEKKCIGCSSCQKNCAHDAITIANKKASIDQDACTGCGRCIGVCPTDAVRPGADNSNDVLNYKMVEYAAAILHGRPHFHVSLAMDISPYCDCHAENDVPIVPDVGMFASFDPVAIDIACADEINKQPVSAGSCLDEKEHIHGDHFCDTHPSTDWKGQIAHAEKIGLGRGSYELIKI